MKILKIIAAGNSLYYPQIPQSFDHISDSLYILGRFLTTELGVADDDTLKALYEDIFVYRKMSYHVVSFIQMRGKIFMNMLVPLQLKDYVTTPNDLWCLINEWKMLTAQDPHVVYLIEEDSGTMKLAKELPPEIAPHHLHTKEKNIRIDS